MYYFLITSLVIAVTIFILQSRYNVIEELRKPFGLFNKIREQHRLLILLSVLFYFALTSLFLWPMLLGDRPISGSHIAHFTKAHILNDLLSDWTLRGWTDKLFVGFPYGYTNSALPELMTVALNTITFDSLSLSKCYALVVFLSLFVKGLSGFVFGYRSFGLSVGFVTGILLVVDPGGINEGGRTGALESGAWVSDLSISCLFFALAYSKDLWTHPNRRSFFIFCFFSGLAILIHPIAVLGLILVSITAFVSYLATQSVNLAIARRACIRYLCALAIILSIGAYFLLPYFTDADFIRTQTGSLPSVQQIGHKISELSLFSNQSVIVNLCGIIALVLFPFSNKFWPLYIAMTVLFGLLVSSQDISTWLSFLKKAESLTHLRLSDLALILKCFFFTGAAFVLIKSLTALQSLTDIVKIESGKGRAMLRTLLMAVLVAAVFAPLLRQTDWLQIGKNSATFNSEADHEKDLNNVAKWLKKRTQKKAVLDRVALWQSNSKMELLDLSFRIPQLIYPGVQTETINYKFKPESHNNSLLDYLQVRYIVTDKSSLSRKYYKRRTKFGKYRIYENKKYTKNPWRIIRGSGKIRNLKIQPERITFETNKSSSGKAMLFVSHYNRWKLTVNDADRPIEGRAFKGLPYTHFMTFDMEPGKYQLEFKRNAIDYLSVILSIVGILLLIAICFNSRIGYRIL